MSVNMLLFSILLFVVQMGIGNAQKLGPIDDREELYSHFAKYFMSYDMTDCGLYILGRRIPAHRLILTANSEFFRKVFNNTNMSQPHQQDYAILTPIDETFDFKLLLKYLYTGKINVIQFTVQELINTLEVVHMYDLGYLYYALEEIIVGELDTSNVIQLTKVGKRLRLERLMEASQKYLEENLSEMFSKKDHVTLSFDEFNNLLSKPNPNVTMLVKFLAVANWLHAHEGSNETINREPLMANIDLFFISSFDIIEFVRPTNLYPQQYLFDHLAARDINPAGSNLPPQDPSNVTVINYRRTGYTTSTGMKIEELAFDPRVVVNYLSFVVNPMENQTCFNIKASLDKDEWTVVFNYNHTWNNRYFEIYFEGRVTGYIKLEGNFNITKYKVLSMPNNFDKGFVEAPFSALTQTRFIMAVPTKFNEVLKPLKRGYNSSLPYQTVGRDLEIFFTFLQPYWVQQCLLRVMQITGEASAIEITLYDELGQQSDKVTKDIEDGWVEADFGLQIVSKIGVKAKDGKDYRFIYFTAS